MADHSDPTKPGTTVYAGVIKQSEDGHVVRAVATDDQALAEVLATALRGHPAPRPSPQPSLSLALQGNLCEFFVWDLGAADWALFEKRWTWTANAASPWKASSDPGVDILALIDIDSTDPGLLAIEVKSSNGDGVSLVNGSAKSLRSDFQGLYRGLPQYRVTSRVAEILCDLRYRFNRPDLEEPVKLLVGTGPTSSGIRLAGVLVCARGDSEADAERRRRAFDHLREALRSDGWGTALLRSIEVSDISEFLTSTIRRACGD